MQNEREMEMPLEITKMQREWEKRNALSCPRGVARPLGGPACLPA